MAWFKSIFCAAGEHEKCRDGASRTCACRCGHRAALSEARENVKKEGTK